MNEKKKKGIAAGMMILLFVWYLGGFLSLFVGKGRISFSPFICLKEALSLNGAGCMVLIALMGSGVAAGIAMRGKEGIPGEDAERHFSYSAQGTYGTAGYMTRQEQKQILALDQDVKQVDGIILGSDVETGAIISLPQNSPLNRNFAVCGSQGSMKSRAFARNMILQCAKRGESMFLTDPKSELYEDTAHYLEENGYLVKQYNLIRHECSDSWDCLAEIDGGLIDVFVDVVIRNTTDKFDHFYDNTEMDLLKALCLYVYHEYPEGRRNFAECYKLLLHNSLDRLDAIFENLPVGHPARGPYQLFSKAEKVKGNAVLGLGTRLQIMQNDLIQTLTSVPDIDLTLPGKQKCAYFCITSDQDSTYDVLATLLVSFLFIKLVRVADSQKDRKLPVPVYLILDEMPNIGIIPSFTKKLATARSRGIGVCMIYQNIPQLQNRYPDTQWEELLGGCDTALFLGCNDMTTATYFSDRSGEVTVGVSSTRKNFHTIRLTDYVPEYAESASVGKRKLLLPDEILRFPLSEALLVLRGQKVLRIKKYDYSKHPESLKFVPQKAEDHVPEWRKKREVEKEANENGIREEVFRDVEEDKARNAGSEGVRLEDLL